MSDEKDGKGWSSFTMCGQHPALRKLEPIEKQFLLAVEHGDVAKVER